MKNLFLFAFLFSACASSTSVNPADEWNIGVFHGRTVPTPPDARKGTLQLTTMKLKNIGSSSIAGIDSITGFYYFSDDTARAFAGQLWPIYNNGVIIGKQINGVSHMGTYPHTVGGSFTNLNMDTLIMGAWPDTLIKQ